MLYCSIERTNCHYDTIFSCMKLIQLENDAKFGDVFDGYILCEQGNPLILTTGEEVKSYKFKKGYYVNLIPLDLISILVSDSDDLIINGFEKHEQKTTFHPLLGFQSDGENLGDEIIDYDTNKEKIVTRYYYIKTK